ncbi:DNA repair protein RecN (Recombination protein N) [Comamonas odontotermitis]|uniref:DNA repair protein RecN n=1 Tax=Comamonas odontotermitis TaxID=379895 RepID=A0ABR6RHX5_9BURK|nr:DNA repair protein RecN [Comamonas odontotermitis]MBB6578749.1 DNA repair protein RecN (Recombination protein N) [Comamonas odontotermitis]
MSLKRIALRDFVIVEQLEVDFSPGFTALTGETGAGKSILIDALQLVLGSRADTGFVRQGAAKSELIAEFDTPPALKPYLTENELQPDESVLLRRVIDAQGKSKFWINGVAATATQLRSIAPALVDIHGQHAWQSLMQSEPVRRLLDAYANADCSSVQEAYLSWRAADKTLQQARSMEATHQRERERLLWQISEVDKLAPTEHEWEELNAQHTRLSHAQTLMDAATHALAALEDEDSGASVQANRALHTLQAQAHVEPQFAAMAETLEGCVAQLEDLARSLGGYLRHAELDPDKLEQLDERLGSWLSLARRYKRPPEDLPALLQGWKNELKALDASADIHALENAAAAGWKAYEKAAQALSKIRARAAERLSQAITSAMQELGMAGGRFVATIHPAKEPRADGMDDVELLVAGHPGTEPKPIAKVASGGELSRISLAIAISTSQLGQAPTLIFDEIDSGIGGAVADAVGRVMHALGQDRQVLAVTHLAQVAARGDTHLVVTKQRSKSGTSSHISAVTENGRVDEIARMLGGEHISSTSRAHAREMIAGGVHDQ